MWMDEKPTRESNTAPPLSMTLGADSQAVSSLMGVVSSVVNTHKNSETHEPTFRIADLNIGDGHIAANAVRAVRDSCGKAASSIRVSGTDVDLDSLDAARRNLKSCNALGTLAQQDASSSPANMLRNRLKCGGGADMVMYAHAAYPDKLTAFKLPRMVDRLGDMAAPHGAVLTLHNHGPSDVDDIRQAVLGVPGHSVAGLNCNTQHRLEKTFQDARLHSFSVTVPATIDLPANMRAVEGIFIGDEKNLGAKDQKDAKAIRQTLETMAGGAAPFKDAVAAMDGAQRVKAVQYFDKRIKAAGGKDLPITIGGGQMVMAFRSQQVAQEAFAAVNEACQEMVPPAIALPISRDVMPEFDKKTAHAEWTDTLQKSGIKPPRVCQSELERGR